MIRYLIESARVYAAFINASDIPCARHTSSGVCTVPKLLGLLEDVVLLHAAKRNIMDKIDYGHLRMIFENLHLPPGVNALEEVGIPVQTLYRMASVVKFPEELGVGGLADYLRASVDAWKDIGEVDQTFVRRALGVAQEFS